jgi:hypothetical protein
MKRKHLFYQTFFSKLQIVDAVHENKSYLSTMTHFVIESIRKTVLLTVRCDWKQKHMLKKYN